MIKSNLKGETGKDIRKMFIKKENDVYLSLEENLFAFRQKEKADRKAGRRSV